MKTWIAHALLLTLLVTGCNDRRTSSGPDEAEWHDRDVVDMTTDRKEAYRQGIRTKLDVLERQLDDLRSRAAAAGEEARARLRPHIETLRQTIQTAERRLEELRDDSSAAWRTARPQLEEALSNLNEAFRRAANEFRR